MRMNYVLAGLCQGKSTRFSHNESEAFSQYRIEYRLLIHSYIRLGDDDGDDDNIQYTHKYTQYLVLPVSTIYVSPPPRCYVRSHSTFLRRLSFHKLNEIYVALAGIRFSILWESTNPGPHVYIRINSYGVCVCYSWIQIYTAQSL